MGLIPPVLAHVPQDGVFRTCVVPSWASVEELMVGAVDPSRDFAPLRLKRFKLGEAEVGYGSGACANLGKRLVSALVGLAGLVRWAWAMRMAHSAHNQPGGRRCCCAPTTP